MRVIKFIIILKTHLVFETMSPINRVGQEFISELGQRMSASTDDPREVKFLFRMMSVALQRFNPVYFHPLSTIVIFIDNHLGNT